MQNWRHKCPLCGRIYYESDGGCVCEDSMGTCSCGIEEWVNDGDRIICQYCEEEPEEA